MQQQIGVQVLLILAPFLQVVLVASQLHWYSDDQDRYGHDYEEGNQQDTDSDSNLAFPIDDDDDLQSYLFKLFDWNYEMSEVEFEENCGNMPNMEKLCENVSRTYFFYDMNPNCMSLVTDLNTVLADESSPLSALKMAMCMRDSEHMNVNAWIRGLLMQLVGERQELRGLAIPPLVEVVPSLFVQAEVMDEVKNGLQLQQGGYQQQGTCTPVNGQVGEDNGIENLLWYWREDVMVNSFHWYWHLTYPFMGTTTRGDRRGELFYYTHHSLVARYHAERLSVGLPATEPLELYPGTRIQEPYNPHLNDINAGNSWTPRMPNILLRNIENVPLNGDPQMVDIVQRLRYLKRIEQAIKAGVALASKNQKVPLRNFDGIDILGDIIEASIWSINQELYGFPGVHNEGHILIGLIEDPDGSEGLAPGVMADPATAMRDPIFYRYHTTVDAYFTKYKDTLPPYELNEGYLPLVNPGVEVKSLAIVPVNGRRVNKLKTFFNTRTFDLARGLDFNRTFVRGPLNLCVKHLDYQKFNYEIVIKRNVYSSSRATIRIFLAPRYNEHGQRYSLEEQRLLFFQLDRFPVYLVPGLNKIIRKSTESTLTVPFPQSYNELQQQQGQTPSCGCGWPEHLLIPRGTINGLDFDLFVMVTNGDEDAVPVPKSMGDTAQQQQGQQCRPAPIFCGIVGESYPDARPMGYPFDRRPYSAGGGGGGGGGPGSGWIFGKEPWNNENGDYEQSVETIEEYTSNIPNAATVQVRIYHKGMDNVVVYPLRRKDIFPSKTSCQPYHYSFLCFIYSMLYSKKR